MKFRLPWNKQKFTLEGDLATLERKLSGALRPVEPNKHFVRSLRMELAGNTQNKILGLERHQVQNGLLVAGGILSLSVMILAGVRMLLAILGALGLVQLKKQMDEPVKLATPSPR